MSYSLNRLYRIVGVSKQAVHQSRKRQQRFDMELLELTRQADLIRKDHPGCGVEKMYHILQPESMGRDKFCEIFMELGYGVGQIKNRSRTTIPSWYHYPNLIEGMAVVRPYQVIQSDITYFDIEGKFYYLVFILDVYTREILGYNVGDNMRAECNVRALKMALKNIPASSYDTLIHHSDRGAQYVSDSYTRILTERGIQISMGEIAQDNAFVERVNGTIKNEYLRRWVITDFNSLKRKVRKAVNHYNEERLHLAFKNRYSPLGFKRSLLALSDQKRPKVIIYAEGNYKIKAALSRFDFRPEKEPQAHNCPIWNKEKLPLEEFRSASGLTPFL